MDNRLDNLRMFFPAEVTGAYLAIQSLLKANHISATEFTTQMVVVACGLAIVNVAMYWKFYDVTNIGIHLVLLVGFFIWVINIDMPRFKDIEYFGTDIEIYAPSLLIFYSLLTLFIAAPARSKNAPSS